MDMLSRNTIRPQSGLSASARIPAVSRIPLGLCTSVDRVDAAHAMGYDYVEPGLSWLASLDEYALASALRIYETSGIKPEAFNLFVPGSLPLVGPSVDMTALTAYVDLALSRAAKADARVIVFGSGGARNVPEGFPREAAMEQVMEFLTLCDGYATAAGVRIAIEPLRKQECNLINRVSEATSLARRLALPSIGVLADTFHMHFEDEPLSAIVDAGSLLWHVHVAHPATRHYPAPDDGGGYAAVFDALHSIGYAGRVSVEVSDSAFDPGAAIALQTLRNAQASVDK